MVYPTFDDPDFYEKILKKKEFLDNTISQDQKDIFCYEPQQRFLANYINPKTPYTGMLVYHELGTGKTQSSIAVAEKHPNWNIFVLSKSDLIGENYRYELTTGCESFETVPARYTFNTFDSLVNLVIKKDLLTNKQTINESFKLQEKTILIIDEAHNAVSTNIYKCLEIIKRNTKDLKILLLTGTPMYDKFNQIFPLMNLLLPDEKKFPEYPKSDTVSQDQLNAISERSVGIVSYLKSNLNTFPKKQIYLVNCEMSDFQKEWYLKSKAKSGTLLNKEVASSLIVYPNGKYDCKEENSMCLDSSHVKKYSTKLYNLGKMIKKHPQKKHFIYSNNVYKSAGTEIISIYLQRNFPELSLIYINDSVSGKKRFEDVERYNSLDSCILLCSSIISEGVSLKNTDFVHIIDPHWNCSRINQVIGRAIRKESHSDPKAVVQVLKYIASDTDSHKYEISKTKQHEIESVLTVLKSRSIDCNLNFSRNEHKCNPDFQQFIPEWDPDYTNYDTPPEVIKFIQKKLISEFKRSFYIKKLDFAAKNSFSESETQVAFDVLEKTRTLVKGPTNLNSVLFQTSNFFICGRANKGLYRSLELLVQPSEISFVPEPARKFPVSKPKAREIDISRFDHVKDPIFGTYLNKFGDETNILRIVDTTGIETGINNDRRKLVSGKNVNSFTKESLSEIYFKLTGTEIYSTKAAMISKITKFLVENKLIY
jgi:superfamily II DNA or RNA helicase